MADPPKIRGASSSSAPPTVPRTATPTGAPRTTSAQRIKSPSSVPPNAEQPVPNQESSGNRAGVSDPPPHSRTGSAAHPGDPGDTGQSPTRGESLTRDGAGIIDQLFELVDSESAALRDRDDHERQINLHIRAALVAWAASESTSKALHHLELAEGHPMAGRLRLLMGLAEDSSEALATTQAKLGAALPGALAIEVTEAWLLRHNQPKLAAASVDAIATKDLPTLLRTHVLDLTALAHAAAGNWANAIKVLRRALTETSPANDVAATAALMLDRTNDAAGALALCWNTLDRVATKPSQAQTDSAAGVLRLLDVAIEAALHSNDVRRLELLQLRCKHLQSLTEPGAEVLAARAAVATELARSGQHALALVEWLEIAGASAASLPEATRRIANYAALIAATATGNRTAALAAHRQLMTTADRAVAASHAWRAFELAALADAPPPAEILQVADQQRGTRMAEWWLDWADIANPTSLAIARLEVYGGLRLRWAATLAERTNDHVRAIELWRRAAAADSKLGSEYDHVARIARADAKRRDAGAALLGPGALAETYDAWARNDADQQISAALHCTRGVVAIVRGEARSAEDALRIAAELDPNDPVCLTALAAVYRANNRYDQLAHIVGQLANILASGDRRAAASREHAELLTDRLGDRAGARAALERAVADRPTDSEALLALARMCDADEQWAQSIDLLARAVALPIAADRKAQIWSDIGQREERRGNREGALEALAKAAKAAPRRGDLRREQARMYRQAGRFDQALHAVRTELKGDPEQQRLVELKLEEAQLLTTLDRMPEAVKAYLEVLRLEPEHEQALAGIETPARTLGLWSSLAGAFRSAPASSHNLEVLAEALGKTAEWSELADVRKRQLERASTPDEKAQRAGEIAALYEHQLGDLPGAVAMLTTAQASVHDEGRHRDLTRLLRTTERWAELAQVMERDLRGGRFGQLSHRLEVLLELGALRADKLDREADAITAFEGVLELNPDNSVALDRLEVLYEKLGRDRDLARLLDQRAAQAALPVARAELLGRAAALRAKFDVDGSIANYFSAFRANPANRDVFTSLERICYEAERWDSAMQLYDTAIALVETGKGPAARAYRLGDLYARRGSVQLTSLGQVEAAIESYKRVVEVDSKPEAAANTLEELCLQRNDWTPLITAWEQRADFHHEPARRIAALRAAASLATQRAGDPKLAMRLNHKLLSADPSDPDAFATLADYYEGQQDFKDLLAVLKARLPYAAATETVGILNRIARASEDGARDVNSATEHYQKILDIEADNREALEALGRIYESTERWTEFVEITRRQIAVTTDRTTKALLYFRCGSVMEAKFGREAEAIRYYDAAIKATPTCLPAVHGLRDLYRRREEWPRVIETLELEVKVWTDEKERAGVFAQIGRIYEQQLNDTERAMTYFDSALVVDPDCLPANQAVFDHYVKRGEWDRAKPIANSLAQKAMREGDPSTRSEFHRKRGVVARHTFEPKAAAESFIVALEVRPANTEALDDLGELATREPDVWDFAATYRELEKLYRKREDASHLLARVYVGQGAIACRSGDLDAAAALYRQAIELASTDFTILAAFVDFHCSMRRWEHAIAAIQKFVASSTSLADRVAAFLRQATIHAEGEMDASRAIEVLRNLLQLDPTNQQAWYEVAQQYFLVGRNLEASDAIDRVIALATAPGQPLLPEALARYYYYRGRILDATGDTRSAASQFRRAIEYDPGYSPPALALAHRAADGGDQQQAETLLIEAAHAAMAQGGPTAAVPLQRGLANILLRSGDRRAAIEAYRGILNVEPDNASDRVALAEIYAVEDHQRAISELRKVLERDVHHAPAYRLLASLYEQTGEFERAMRVLAALESLGFAEPTDRDELVRLRTSSHPQPVRRALDEPNRSRLLATTAIHEPLGEVWSALAEEITGFIAQPVLGDNLAPAASHSDQRLVQLASEVGNLFDCSAEVFVGDRIPGLLAVTAFPQRMIVVDRTVCDQADVPLRFLLGYAFEMIRGGYAALFQLGAKKRRELAQLLRALISDGDVPGFAVEIINRASFRASKTLERYAGTRDLNPDAWMDGMLACAKRAGLIACDDFAAAIWMIARQAGDPVESKDDTAALGDVLGGPDLVRFYLSDQYQMVRDLLSLAA